VGLQLLEVLAVTNVSNNWVCQGCQQRVRNLCELLGWPALLQAAAGAPDQVPRLLVQRQGLQGSSVAAAAAGAAAAGLLSVRQKVQPAEGIGPKDAAAACDRLLHAVLHKPTKDRRRL
jgi:hypothetical protein